MMFAQEQGRTGCTAVRGADSSFPLQQPVASSEPRSAAPSTLPVGAAVKVGDEVSRVANRYREADGMQARPHTGAPGEMRSKAATRPSTSRGHVMTRGARLRGETLESL